jgi:hypothetical protein
LGISRAIRYIFLVEKTKKDTAPIPDAARQLTELW